MNFFEISNRPYYDGCGRAHRDIYFTCLECRQKIRIGKTIDGLISGRMEACLINNIQQQHAYEDGKLPWQKSPTLTNVQEYGPIPTRFLENRAALQDALQELTKREQANDNERAQQSPEIQSGDTLHNAAEESTGEDDTRD